MDEELPIYTVVRHMVEPTNLQKKLMHRAEPYEILAVKNKDGIWDLVGDESYWFNSDEELAEQWPDYEVVK